MGIKINGKVIDIYSGKVMIVSDFHKNEEDFFKAVNIFEQKTKCGEDVTLVIAGDSETKNIHSSSMELVKRYGGRFIPLLGNHESGQIMELYNVCKIASGGFFVPEIALFAEQIRDQKEKYIEFFKSMPLVVRLKNGIVISHAGASKKVGCLDDIARINWDSYSHLKGNYRGFINTTIGDFLWNRDIDKATVAQYLKAVGNGGIEARISICGHYHTSFLDIRSIEAGIGKIGKNLIILTLSDEAIAGKKPYLEIDVNKTYNTINDFKEGIEIKELYTVQELLTSIGKEAGRNYVRDKNNKGGINQLPKEERIKLYKKIISDDIFWEFYDVYEKAVKLALSEPGGGYGLFKEKISQLVTNKNGDFFDKINKKYSFVIPYFITPDGRYRLGQEGPIKPEEAFNIDISESKQEQIIKSDELKSQEKEGLISKIKTFVNNLYR